MASTGGDAGVWLALWELWVGLHLLAVYYLRGLKKLTPTAHDQGAEGRWTSAVPWRLLSFHLMRAFLVPVGMGFLPYWIVAASY